MVPFNFVPLVKMVGDRSACRHQDMHRPLLEDWTIGVHKSSVLDILLTTFDKKSTSRSNSFRIDFFVCICVVFVSHCTLKEALQRGYFQLYQVCLSVRATAAPAVPDNKWKGRELAPGVSVSKMLHSPG